MIVITRNTRYTLVNAGGGAWLISGNATYCPKPLLVTLLASPIEGEPMFFRAVDAKAWAAKGFRTHVITSPVKEIIR